MIHLKDLEECLEGKTSSSTEADSIVAEGRHCLDNLDAASSKAKAELEHHAKECDEVEAKQQALKAQPVNTEQEVSR